MIFFSELSLKKNEFLEKLFRQVIYFAKYLSEQVLGDVK